MARQNTNYLVIARKYRPKKFSQVVGQEHVIQTLSNSISTGRIAQAYLLVGPRGIGKTTTARLLAAALNAPGSPSVEADPSHPDILSILEGRSLDVREIDGASNNGVEQVRELRDDVRYQPQTGRYKIYIIDEVHMLSTAAFNALLKTLEEPPPHVKFIFATTEVQKVPATILSRCQRFDLRRIPTELIARQLATISEAEGITAEPGALHAIARLADGGMRDAQSILDQMISYCGETVKEADVLQILGIPPRSSVIEILGHILNGETAPAWKSLYTLDSQGKDLGRVLADLVCSARELLIAQQAPELIAAELSPEDLSALEPLKSVLKPAKLLRLLELLSQAESRMRFALQPKIWLEITIAAAAQVSNEIDLNDVISSLRKCEISAVRPAPDLEPNPGNQRTQQPAPHAQINNSHQNSSLDQITKEDSNEKPKTQKTEPGQIDAQQQPAATSADRHFETKNRPQNENKALAAWQSFSDRLPHFILQGMQAACEDNHLKISIDEKILNLLEAEWPKEKIESELKQIHPDLVLSWLRHNNPSSSKLPNDTNLSLPVKTTPKAAKKTPAAVRPNKTGSSAQNHEDIRKPTPEETEEFQNDTEIKTALASFGARLVEIRKTTNSPGREGKV